MHKQFSSLPKSPLGQLKQFGLSSDRYVKQNQTKKNENGSNTKCAFDLLTLSNQFRQHIVGYCKHES